MGDDGISRRSFLKFLGAGMLALTGCSTVSVLNFGNSPQRLMPHEGIRVMSYNIANARGPTEEFLKVVGERELHHNLDEIIKLIYEEDVDVVCMNEVDFDSIRTRNIDQAEYIAKKLGYNHIIKDNFLSMPSVLSMGNAVLSRYPLKLNLRHKLGKYIDGEFKHLFKTYIDFDVIAENKSLNFILTHFDDRADDAKTIAANSIISRVKCKQCQYVVLGDFNSSPKDRWMQELMAKGKVHNQYAGLMSFPSWAPRTTIDHILVSEKLGIENYHTRNLQSSDHLPIIGDILF